MSFPIFTEPRLPLETVTLPTTNLQNLPFQSTPAMPSSSLLLSNHKDYVGHVREMKKSDDVVNPISTTTKSDCTISVHVKSSLPNFLRGTRIDTEKNVSIFKFTDKLHFSCF